MTIERTDKEILIRLSPYLNIDDIQTLLDYLTYKEATMKSQASQEDVDVLVDEVKRVRRLKKQNIALTNELWELRQSLRG